MTPRLVAVFTSILLLAAMLSGCAGAPARDDRVFEIATPIPAYVATDQTSALHARATRQASEGRMAELAAESTAVALQMTASAATEAYFARQTEQAQYAAATATQEAIQATSIALAAAHTQQALNSAGTATQAAANAAGTATQAAYQVQQTSTAIALGVLQASATAEIERIAEQRRSEQQTLLFRTWAGRIALCILFAVGLFIAWQSAGWIRLRLFGVHRLVNRPVVITPNAKGGFTVFDISRSLQPGTTIDQDGQATASGGAANELVQSQVTARAQAAELMLAVNSGQPARPALRRTLLRSVLQMVATQPVQALPPGQVEDASVIVIPPDDPRIRPLLDEIEPKLLNGGSNQ